MERECKIHGLTEYVARQDGGHRCKKCAVDAVQRRRDKVKEMAIEYKGGKCARCVGIFHLLCTTSITLTKHKRMTIPVL